MQLATVCASRLGLARGLIRVAVSTIAASYLHCIEDMDLSALRQQILLSNKTASEKAEDFLLERTLNVMTLDEWRIFVAEIPEDVKRETVKLKPEGTQLHLDVPYA